MYDEDSILLVAKKANSYSDVHSAQIHLHSSKTNGIYSNKHKESSRTGCNKFLNSRLWFYLQQPQQVSADLIRPRSTTQESTYCSRRAALTLCSDPIHLSQVVKESVAFRFGCPALIVFASTTPLVCPHDGQARDAGWFERVHRQQQQHRARLVFVRVGAKCPRCCCHGRLIKRPLF